MTVGLVGDGPAVSAVRSALDDGALDHATIDASAVDTVDLAVVVDDVGAAVFERINSTARSKEVPWLAVELGGIGGRDVEEVDASVAGFGPTVGCYECLQARVTAGHDEGTTTAVEPSTPRFAGAIAGREAHRLLAGHASDILGGVREVPHAARSFFPVPTCACRGDRDWRLRLTHEPTAFDTAVGHAERALDTRVGIVTQVGEIDSFPAPYYLAEVAETEGFSDASVSPHAAGVADDWDTAFLKAVGEALERYSAGVYRTAALPTGATADIPNAIDPATFVAAPGVEQPDGETALSWIPGLDLHEETAVHLPAGLVLFPPPRQVVRPPSTTGLALGSTTLEAVLSGLYETLERDAAMLAWYSTYEPLGLAVPDDQYQTVVSRAGSENLDVTALLLTQDVDVPVVGVAVHRLDGDWPRMAMGMGANLDPTAAARAGLAEALQNWMELRRMASDRAHETAGAIATYAADPTSVRSFLDVERTIPADSVGPATVPDGREELTAVLDRVADAGMGAYAARLTPADVDRLGFSAVRVLLPAAQPLVTDDPYFGSRAREVPHSLGFEPRLDRAQHPYP